MAYVSTYVEEGPIHLDGWMDRVCMHADRTDRTLPGERREKEEVRSGYYWVFLDEIPGERTTSMATTTTTTTTTTYCFCWGAQNPIQLSHSIPYHK